MTTTCDTFEEATVPESTQTPATGAVTRVETPYAVLRWLVLATFVVILNETIMVNAIPRLMVELDVSARSAQWLSTAFMLTMAVVIPVTGWFLQRVTTRQAFATAMTVFLLGTAMCALAPVFWMLVGRPGRAGRRHRGDAAAADDDADDDRARVRPRPGDGQRHARDLGRPRARPGRVRRRAPVRLVALAVRAGAADRRGRHLARPAPADQRRRDPEGRTRRARA